MGCIRFEWNHVLGICREITPTGWHACKQCQRVMLFDQSELNRRDMEPRDQLSSVPCCWSSAAPAVSSQTSLSMTSAVEPPCQQIIPLFRLFCLQLFPSYFDICEPLTKAQLGLVLRGVWREGSRIGVRGGGLMESNLLEDSRVHHSFCWHSFVRSRVTLNNRHTYIDTYHNHIYTPATYTHTPHRSTVIKLGKHSTTTKETKQLNISPSVSHLSFISECLPQCGFKVQS